MSERLWLMREAISALNDDTPALEQAVRDFLEYTAKRYDVAAEKLAGHVLWPALFDKVCAGRLVARGRRDGATEAQDIPKASFIRSVPDFETDSFRGSGSLFEDVHFVRQECQPPAAATVPIKRKPGPQGLTTKKVAEAMAADIRNGKTTLATLKSDKIETLKVRYPHHADTIKKALALVSQIIGNANSINSVELRPRSAGDSAKSGSS